MDNSKARGMRYLAIDLDPEGLLVVSGPAGASGSRVERTHAWLPGNEHGPAALTPANAKELGEALRDRLKAAGLPPGPVLVGIGRDKVILKELKHPPVDADSESALIRFQALKEITENADEIVLDYAPLVEIGADPTAERRAMAVVVKKDFFGAVQTMIAAAGLKLVAVTPRPYAVAAGLAQALATGEAERLDSPGDTAAVVTLSPQGGEFTVVREGKVTFTRAIPGQVLVNDALLLGEIKRNLTTYNGQNQSRPVTAVYVPEAESILGGWASKLRNGLAVAVHAFDPVAGAAEAVPANLRGRYAGAAGLLAGRSVGLPINFASPRQPIAKSDPRKKLLLGAALAALVLIFGGGIVGYMTLSAADERVNQRQKDKADLETLLAEAEPNSKRLAAAEQWEARSVNYLDEMFDLSDRMPSGDTLRVSKITGTAVRVDKAGKQNGQSYLNMSVGAKSPGAASDLVSTIDRDNTKDRKYYVGTKKTVGGMDTHTNSHNQLATIETVAMHRAPNEYTRYPVFYAPRRGVIPASAPEPEKKVDETEEIP